MHNSFQFIFELLLLCWYKMTITKVLLSNPCFVSILAFGAVNYDFHFHLLYFFLVVYTVIDVYWLVSYYYLTWKHLDFLPLNSKEDPFPMHIDALLLFCFVLFRIFNIQIFSCLNNLWIWMNKPHFVSGSMKKKTILISCRERELLEFRDMGYNKAIHNILCRCLVRPTWPILYKQTFSLKKCLTLLHDSVPSHWMSEFWIS